ncbi:NUDIX hydrolase [Flavobacterium sp. ARAG 55.4]|uniref:NUDIX hydrolase n=1 Tax=Flavobacterium sp. ARAG 55.4 TaxID=3451357 RepID=UPI003F471A5C
MDFQHFLKIIPNLVQASLPAFASHEKMMPLERKQLLKRINLEEKHPREAAVTMLFYPKNQQTHLVLIVRNSYEGVHSAQIAFPGGKFETGDINLRETALRETEEEIGISRSKIQIVKDFSPLYIPPSNFMVYPFLGVCTEEPAFILDPEEVASIIELPLEVFQDDAILSVENLSTSYGAFIEVPAFKIDEHIVWGATAMMLSELKDVLLSVFEDAE